MTSSIQSPARLLFADAAVESLEASKTLPKKFERMLKRSDLSALAGGKSVAIKMHLGGDVGYTTIHPLFVRILVSALRESGAKSVVVIDGKSPSEGIPRGYTAEVLGCPIRNCFGPMGNDWESEPIGFGVLDEALFGKRALDTDVFINLSHVKGHGDCGFGGALKNIAMGVVPPHTRGKLHRLEGGISYDKDVCTFCLKCLKSCPNGAITANKESRTIEFFFHHCTYCQHCVMACPEGALKMLDRRFEDFSQGMALVTKAFLERFDPSRLFFINVLTNITMYCDCWGFSSPALVPDIGILAGRDLAAIDTASLDKIKTQNLLPNGLPKNRTLLEGNGHLFERIHAKDPYLMLRCLEEIYPCTADYALEEVK
jgi:uncharacterized protein